jgi:hypothetical protein
MDECIIFVLGTFIGFLLCITLVAFPSKVEAYKQGQIDYANGIIKYELKEMPDKSMEWVKKEE